jgi:branched-chain amino acid transport system permease protein
MLIGLVNNYAAYLAPKVALGSSILVMVAVLMWRPEGLLPAAKSR